MTTTNNLDPPRDQDNNNQWDDTGVGDGNGQDASLGRPEHQVCTISLPLPTLTHTLMNHKPKTLLSERTF